MADHRHTDFWCQPSFGKELTEVPDETQGLIYQKADGKFGVLLPVVSEKYKCVLCGKSENQVTAKIFSLYEKLNSCDALAFVCAEGDNPYVLLEKCTAYGLKLLGTKYRTRQERRYTEIFEYLGWCSWDAMEIRFPNGLKACISKMNEYGITVGMWHPTTGYWRGLDPDGETAQKYKDILIQTADGRYVYAPKKDAAYFRWPAF